MAVIHSFSGITNTYRNRKHNFYVCLLYYSFPSIAFICLYSILPHKELRFILPVFPLLYLVTAVGLQEISDKSRVFGSLCRFLLLIISLACSLFSAYVASLNYPGGVALALLNSSVRSTHAKIYIDVDAAMTGVSRFGELRSPSLVYSKDEKLSAKDLESFDWLLTSKTNISDNKFSLVFAVRGFGRVLVNFKELMNLMRIIEIVQEDKLFVYRKKLNEG